MRNIKGQLDIYKVSSKEKYDSLYNIVNYEFTEIIVEDKLNEIAIICGRVIVIMYLFRLMIKRKKKVLLLFINSVI